MTSGVYLTKEEEQQIINLYISGKSSIWIERELGFSKPCILKRLHKNNITIRKHGRFSSRKEYSADRRKNFKNIVFDYYSNGTMRCACCGESHIEFLTVDHINNDGASHRKQIKGDNINTWLVLNNLPNGYRILCMNCNFSHGIHGYCPHDIIEK